MSGALQAEPGVALRRGWRGAVRWQVLGVAGALALVWLGKHFYSQASAAELRWILAPTARLVSWASGGDFVYERGAGWVSRHHAFIIAPACAGVNFALAAFLALVLGSLARMRSWSSLLRRVVVAVGAAYVTTLLVNATRIVIAIALHRGTLELGDASPAELHRVEGILVYLVGLCGLYAAAQAVERALELRAHGRRGGHHVEAR